MISQTNGETISSNSISLDLSRNAGRLNIEVIKKYYGEYDLIAAYLGNGIGITIDNQGIQNREVNEINVGANIVDLPNFATGFEAKHIVPTVYSTLPCDIYMHVNLGAENFGKKAYVFKLSKQSNSYELKGVMDINTIGNIAIQTDEMTDIMILIED
jgi:hypothetical protein